MNRKRTSRKTALARITEEYAGRSTIHGISYLFDKELSIVDQLLWLFVVVGFLGVASALTVNFWTQWRNEQVKTSDNIHFRCVEMIGHCQVVTILKDTTKLIREVPFPALTLCGSGVHMNNVEKQLAKDIIDWKAERKRNVTCKKALEKDLKDFMQEKFHIMQSQDDAQHPINILDILDMMIAPDADASVAVNSVREGVIACSQQQDTSRDNNVCFHSCSDPEKFHLLGTKCFHVSKNKEKYADAVTACQEMGAELATISAAEEESFVLQLRSGSGSVWIGLNDLEEAGKWVWQDGSSAHPYNNWNNGPPSHNVKHCLSIEGGKWNAVSCAVNTRMFACSMGAEKTCNSSKALIELMRRRTCLKNETINLTKDEPFHLPLIDIFLNPSKEQEKNEVIQEKKSLAKNYFKYTKMSSLYPELFRLLWQSTLPCFKEENKEEHMMLSCEVAGVKVNCSDYFTRVPTDMGMCCALNVNNSLRTSGYSDLVKKMQGMDKKTMRMRSQEGKRNGLKLTLDLHSNTVSLGTLDQQHNTFKMFIGEPAQFPMMRGKSFNLEPGREHFVDLSATVVTTKEIRKISPEARGCFFTDEGDLEFYSSYTFSNCRLECQIKHAEKIYKCVPWYLPRVSIEAIR